MMGFYFVVYLWLLGCECFPFLRYLWALVVGLVQRGLGLNWAWLAKLKDGRREGRTRRGLEAGVDFFHYHSCIVTGSLIGDKYSVDVLPLSTHYWYHR
ncbi:hypothetical protein HOY82DRAFT_43716 [Tuber indicum]|nr:hypothetical protein HOY82DRAFT_43716 [Tuber indicum]